MEPTYKASELDNFLKTITGKDRVQTIRNRGCTTCDTTFKTEEDLLMDLGDELYCKEYSISGMCRKCQDSVFNSKEE